MEKRYYNAASIERSLLAYERHYGLPSADFYAAHVVGEELGEIPRFHRHVWASLYRELERLRGGGFAEAAERLLTLA